MPFLSYVHFTVVYTCFINSINESIVLFEHSQKEGLKQNLVLLGLWVGVQQIGAIEGVERQRDVHQDDVEALQF